jgi:hypothetical protein
LIENGRRGTSIAELRSTRESEKIGMTQRQFHRSKSSHGETDDRAVRTAGCNGKLTFYIGDKVTDDVVFVPILRRIDGIRVIRSRTFGHYENHAWLCKPGNIRIVRPIQESYSAPMQ